MSTYYVWLDGDGPEDAVEVQHHDIGLAVECAANLLYDDSGGECFDSHGMRDTTLHVRDVSTGQTDRWKVKMEFNPVFYANKA